MPLITALLVTVRFQVYKSKVAAQILHAIVVYYTVLLALLTSTSFVCIGTLKAGKVGMRRIKNRGSVMTVHNNNIMLRQYTAGGPGVAMLKSS